ncbi:MAG: hypothetical protein JSR77_13385 [Planctomycetes bacterium]|nr:hypothetical protein [Planctomycetota bacterium]
MISSRFGRGGVAASSGALGALRRRWGTGWALGVLCAASAAASGQTMLGPTPYRCFSDSPFASLAFDYFHLETFEDHLFNVPGVSADRGGVTSVVFGPSIHDSVDCDDGVIDGSGLMGDSFFSAAPDITFTFNAAVLGRLPTHAGIVWTDGGGGAMVTFEARAADNTLLGTVTGQHADNSVNGTTAEDRFYGAISDGGIKSIRIRHTSGGLEVDHLQYGAAAAAAPCPADFNQDGGIDGADVQAFFAAWETGDPAADVNQDGGVDGTDVEVFFAAWESGVC